MPPVFVDYLGRFESEPGYVETSSDIARELVERGVEDPKRFVPNAELTVERERIVIRDQTQRYRSYTERGGLSFARF